MRVLAAPGESIFDRRLPGSEGSAQQQTQMANTFSDVLAKTERDFAPPDDPRIRSELLELRQKLAQARLELS